MTDRPILFSAPMVRALLDGRKSQTRRIIDFDGVDKVIDFSLVGTKPDGTKVFEMKGAGGKHICLPRGKRVLDPHFSPRYAVGDRLWVREAWATVNSAAGPGWAYRADGHFIQPEYDGEDFGAGPSFNYDKYPGSYTMWFGDLLAAAPGHPWSSPLHMPRWASRLTLIVTDVRVQRLQEISEADAIAEGIDMESDYASRCINIADAGWPDDLPMGSPEIAVYRALWNSINAKRGYGWATSPWIVAVSFRVVMANIDQAEVA